ncbi:MAG: hypothetical protein JKY86_04130 [Gammaproteobacteria bacterium]|nr:hypothetical protein [Gammaproteobacteria bacterium]
MVINDPSGNWFCNDDSDFLNNSSAAILFDNPTSGIYNIWIGTYGSETALSLDAQLLITEQATDSWNTLGMNTDEQDTVDFVDSNDNVADDTTSIDRVDDSGPVNSRVQFGRKNN